MKEQKRILHISSSIEGGGSAAVFKTTYTLFLNHSSYKNFIAATDTKSTEIELQFEDITKVNILKKTKNYIYSSKNKKLLNEFLKDKNIDIIHIHNYLSCLSPSILSSLKKYKKNHKVKIIQSMHEYHLVCPASCLYSYSKLDVCEKCVGKKYKLPALYTFCSKDGVMVSIIKWLRYLVYGRILNASKIIDEFICVSDFQKDIITREFPHSNKFTTVSNPINTDLFSNNKEEKKDQIIYYGRLSKEKNIELLIQAFSLLIKKEEYKDYNILIIGSGPDEKNIRELAINLLPEKNYKFISHLKQEELINYIAESKISVVPSKLYETFGLTVIEALLCGTVPLVSDIGALKNTVDKTFGYSFENNNVDDLLEKIVYILSNYNLILETIESKEEEILAFSSLENYKNELEKVYFK